MNKPPVISVIIPVYNLEAYVENTLDSVLNQTVLPDEIIVIDDGSTDNTIAILQKIASNAPKGLIRVIRHEHSGPGDTRNYGIQESKGDWLAFLDGDDIWLPNKVSKVLRAIENNLAVEIITHDMIQYNLKSGKEEIIELHKKYNPRFPLFPQLYRRSFFATSCMVVKKTSLLKTGGFDVQLPSSQDYDLWLKIARFAKVFFIKEPLTRYTSQRAGSISENNLQRSLCGEKIRTRHAYHLKDFIGKRKACNLYLTRTIIDLYLATLIAIRDGKTILEVFKILSLSPNILFGVFYNILKWR